MENTLGPATDHSALKKPSVFKSWTFFAVLALVVLASAGAFWLIQSGVFFTDSRRGKNEQPRSPSDDLTQQMRQYVYPVRAVFESKQDKEKEVIEYGSCVAVARREGVVFITAAHVVDLGLKRKEIVIVLGGNEREAKLEVVHQTKDTAFLSLPAYRGKGITLAERESQAEDPVFLFGFPIKYSGTAVPKLLGTGGQVVRTDLPYEKIEGAVLQISGGAHFGSSGGAAVDREGRLVGLVFAARFVKGETTHVYAIPSPALKKLLDK